MDSFSLVKISGSRVTKTLFGKYKELMSAESDEDLENIASDVNTSKKNVEEMKNRMLLRDCSLNNNINQDNHNEWEDLLACQNYTPEDEILHYDEKAKYLGVIKIACKEVLTEEEREIIYHRIISDEKIKLKDLAAKHGVSPERIRQKQEIALQKIRDYMAKMRLIAAN